MNVTAKDKEVLRSLGENYAAIAALPVQKDKMALWRSLNDSAGVQAAVWINEIPWHEMNIDDELTLLTEDPYLQQIETTLRRQIYQWKHMPADMVIKPVVYCQKVIHNSGVGIDFEQDWAIRSIYLDGDPICSHHFEPLLKTEDDLYKIKDPVVTYDEETTMERYQALQDIFNGILDVQLRGEPGFWFALWDGLITWFGVQNGFELLIDDPDFVHKCLKRMTDAYLSGLDQYEKLGLLSSNNDNIRIGSGGYGLTDLLPECESRPYQTKDIWGSSAAQIFTSVSPMMHDEFSLDYEIQWMKRFGRNYYGCCEPLHLKMDILKKVPNLHKISLSPWADLNVAVEKAQGNYVLSCKPLPAAFAGDDWNLDIMRTDLEKVLEKTKGNNVEILMKDISTVRNNPERLFEWEKMAMRLVEKYR